jgi:F-type H+-transporting ATPase subunit b
VSSVELDLLLFAEEGEATEAQEDVPNPVIPAGNELLFAAIFFLLLLVLVKFVFLPPLLRMRQEREEHLRGDRDAADRQRDAVGQTQTEYQASLAGARAEANRLIEEARAAADARRAELQAAVDAELAELRRAAQEEIEASRAAALASLSGDVGDLAVEAASLVIQRDLDRGAQQATIDRVLNGS